MTRARTRRRKEMQFFTMVTPPSEVQTQRASQGQMLSNVCTPRMRSSNWLLSENEHIHLKTSRQLMKCDRILVRDKRLWEAVDGRQGTIIPGGSESKKCCLTKNDIPARIAPREEARWQGEGRSTPREASR